MDLEILLLGEFSLGAASTGPRQQMLQIHQWSGAQGDRGLANSENGNEVECVPNVHTYHNMDFRKRTETSVYAHHIHGF